MERYGLAVEATPAIETTQLWCLNRSFTQGLSLTVDEGYELEAALVRIGSAARRIDSSLPRDQQDLRDLDVSVDQFIRESASQERVRNLLYAYAALYSGADATEWSASLPYILSEMSSR
jgi:hypothetical protein